MAWRFLSLTAELGVLRDELEPVCLAQRLPTCNLYRASKQSVSKRSQAAWGGSMGGNDDLTIGGLLRAAREAAGVTTRQVRKVDGVGCYSSTQISQAETGKVKMSWALVEAYIHQFGCDRQALKSAYEQAKGKKDRDAADLAVQLLGSEVTADSSSDEIGSAYRVEECEQYYHLDERGVIVEVNTICTVTPVRDTEFFGVWYQYFSGKRGEIDVRAGMGCSVAQVREVGDAMNQFVLKLDRPLRVQDKEPRSISYRVLVTSDTPSKPLIRFEYQRDHVTRHAIRVQFTPPALPKEIWWGRGVSTYQLEADPEPAREFSLNGDAFYFRDYRNIAPGERFGIAWRWGM
ncbi:helix-turn-helix transcriptional regulator [Streptomyces sp. NPDC048385]|uniref:helix-turn-helix transcriptional regulator n=1 Tax=Streptomyces sp. NPDC048385 TaxID=3155145 RepID=UPI003431DECA